MFRFTPVFVAAVLLLAALLMLGLLATPAGAAGARRAVKPVNGEFVLMRDVSARHATRKQPPGMAILVNASVQPETASMLGDLELDDAATDAIGAAAPGVHVQQSVGQALHGAGLLQGGRSGVPAVNTGGPVGVLGSVGGATRGIGNQITGALQGAGLLKGGG